MLSEIRNNHSLLSGAASLAALGAFTGIVCAVFNPGFLGAVGILAGIGFLKTNIALRIPYFRRRYIESEIAEGRVHPLSSDHPLSLKAAEISRKYGMPVPPDILVSTQDCPSVRSFSDRGWYRKRTADDFSFQAMLGANLILIKKAVLESDHTDKELDFILAHEIRHLKDSNSVYAWVNHAVHTATEALFKTTLLCAGLATLGAFAPAAVALGGWAGGAVALIGASFIADAGLKFGERAIERLADRKALELTGDLDAALGVIAKIQEVLPDAQKPAFCERLLSGHPLNAERKASLQCDWKRVAAGEVMTLPQTKQSVKSNHLSR